VLVLRTAVASKGRDNGLSKVNLVQSSFRYAFLLKTYRYCLGVMSYFLTL
jgi:hypothetical protein